MRRILHKGWNKLSETFHARFKVAVALDSGLQREVYRVRHAVYCEEFGFEETNTEQLEMDQFDDNSTAILIKDITNNQYIACARIVHVSPASPSDPLPFEIVTAGHLYRWVAEDTTERRRVGEISRLAVTSQFRRRRTDVGPAPLSEHDFAYGGAVQRFPFIMAGLYLGLLAVADIEGLDRLYLLTEQRLANHLSRLGVEITQVGDPVEHRGLRVPSVIQVRSVVSALQGFVRPLYDEIHGEIAHSLHAIPAQLV